MTDTNLIFKQYLSSGKHLPLETIKQLEKGSLSKEILGPTRIAQSFESAYLLLLNALATNDPSLLPNLEPKLLLPAIQTCLDKCKNQSFTIEMNSPPKLFCQVKEVLKYDTTYVSSHLVRAGNENLKTISRASNERRSWRVAYDPASPLKSLRDIRVYNRAHVVVMSNLKLRVKNGKGEVVYGCSAPDASFKDDSFTQAVCVFECLSSSYVSKPMPFPQSVRDSDLYRKLTNQESNFNMDFELAIDISDKKMKKELKARKT
jgi:hypothetical protein